MNSRLKRFGIGLGVVLALCLFATSIAAAAQFTSSAYPTTYHGSGSAEYGYVTTQAGSMECATGSTSATLSEASSTLTIVEPAVSGCKSFGFVGSTVTTNGCASLVHVKEQTGADTYSATVDLLCPEGKAIVTVGGECETKVFPQTGNVTVKLTNDTEKGSVKVDLLSSSFKYTVTKDGFSCGYSGTGEKTGGTFSQTKTAVIAVEGKKIDVG